MTLKTHGSAALRSGRARLEADYHPNDGGIGTLSLRLENQETFDSVNGVLRLDPWIADEYELIEFTSGNCLLICGAQAIVSLDASSLVWLSSISLEYEEVDSLDSPWRTEIEGSQLLVMATERRVWCIDKRGTIRWLWSCETSHEDRWIVDEPFVEADRVRVPLRTMKGDLFVELQLGDGLPAR